ncbi:hypothetical protein B0H34DRAFT_678143 [Crassisporium funariophilum]|nr:hypothetical protein B0H34DRAFT_678143 [Crassisporium funariophilum]
MARRRYVGLPETPTPSSRISRDFGRAASAPSTSNYPSLTSETGGAAQGAATATTKASSFFYTNLYILLTSPPRNSDWIFERPASAFTSTVFALESHEISAARRAHINLKLSFVDIGDGRSSARRCDARGKFHLLHLPIYTPLLPPSQFQLDIWTSGERFHLDRWRREGQRRALRRLNHDRKCGTPMPHSPSLGDARCFLHQAPAFKFVFSTSGNHLLPSIGTLSIQQTPSLTPRSAHLTADPCSNLLHSKSSFRHPFSFLNVAVASQIRFFDIRQMPPLCNDAAIPHVTNALCVRIRALVATNWDLTMLAGQRRRLPRRLTTNTAKVHDDPSSRRGYTLRLDTTLFCFLDDHATRLHFKVKH